MVYEFSGYFNKEGVAFERLELKFGKISSKFWGALDNNALRLNGFILLSDLFDSGLVKNDFNLEKPKNGNRLFTQVVSSNSDIYDFEGLIRFDPSSVEIQKFSGTVDGVPLNLEGSFSFGSDLLTDLRLSSFSRQVKESRSVNPKAFDLAVSGKWGQGGFNGKMVYEHMAFVRRGFSERKVDMLFKGLNLDFDSGQEVKIFFDKGVFYYLCGSERYGLEARGFKAVGQLKKTGLDISSLNARLYGGYLKGKGSIDISSFPSRSYFELGFEKVDLKNAVSLFEPAPDLRGSVDSDFIYSDYPWENIKGSFIIRDGGVGGLSFFKWLGNNFGIKEFNTVDFKTAFAYFYCDSENVLARKLFIDSDKVKLRGNFNLKSGLISSTVSAVFSRRLLEDSQKLKPLVAILGKDMPLVDFNFQLSGVIGALNFKWLNSDFKERLYKKIPGFVRGTVEKDIEGVLKPLLAQ